MNTLWIPIHVRVGSMMVWHWIYKTFEHQADTMRGRLYFISNVITLLQGVIMVLTVFTLENRNGSWRIEPLRKGFWGRGTVPGCGVTVSLMLCVSTYTYI